MSDLSLKPALRFKGFTEAWEQRKLGDITFQSGEKNACGLQYESYSVSNKDGFINQREQFKYGGLVTIADKSKSIIITPHTFAYNPARIDIGSIGYLNIDRSVLISPMYETFKADNSILDDRFLWHWLKSDIFSLIVKNNQEGGVRTCFNLSKFFNSYITISKEIGEQRKIGKFLDELNVLITLHQRKQKVSILHRRKKSVYFCYSWEQRKVTKLGKIYIGLVTTMTDHYTDKGTLLIRNSDIRDCHFEFDSSPIYLEESFAKANSSRMHMLGDVITVHTGDVGTSAVINENLVNSIGFATIVTRPNLKVVMSNYLCVFLNTDKHKKWAIGVSTGDGRTNYNLGDYCKCIIPVPTIIEQQQISNFIFYLNTLITLHQRKQANLILKTISKNSHFLTKSELEK